MHGTSLWERYNAGVDTVLSIILPAIVLVSMGAIMVATPIWTYRWNRRIRLEGPPANPPGAAAKFAAFLGIALFAVGGAQAISFAVWGSPCALFTAIPLFVVAAGFFWRARQASRRGDL